MSWIVNIHLVILAAVFVTVGAKPMEENLQELEKLPHIQNIQPKKDDDAAFVLLSHSEEPDEPSSNKELYHGIAAKKRILGGTGMAPGGCGGHHASMGPLINLLGVFHLLSSVFGLLNTILPLDLLGKLTGGGMIGCGGAHHTNPRPTFQEMVPSSNYYNYRE